MFCCQGDNCILGIPVVSGEVKTVSTRTRKQGHLRDGAKFEDVLAALLKTEPQPKEKKSGD